MKFCPKCGTSLEDSVKFCAKCGAQQKIKDVIETNTTEPQVVLETQETSAAQVVVQEEPIVQINSQAAEADNQTVYVNQVEQSDVTEKKIATISNIALGGIIAIAVAQVAPVASVIGLISKSIFDALPKTAIVFWIASGFSWMKFQQKKNEDLLFVSNGAFAGLVGLWLLVKYVLKEEAKKGEFNGFAAEIGLKALSFEWGFYLLIIGLLCLEYVGITSRLNKKQQTINVDSVIAELKQWFCEKRMISDVEVPNYTITLIFGAIVLLSTQKF